MTSSNLIFGAIENNSVYWIRHFKYMPVLWHIYSSSYNNIVIHMAISTYVHILYGRITMNFTRTMSGELRAIYNIMNIMIDLHKGLSQLTMSSWSRHVYIECVLEGRTDSLKYSNELSLFHVFRFTFLIRL